MPVDSEQRFSQSNPCPVCGGGYDDPRGTGTRCHGFAADNGEWVECSREEYAGGCTYHEGSGTYGHRLTGPCLCGRNHGEDDNSRADIPIFEGDLFANLGSTPTSENQNGNRSNENGHRIIEAVYGYCDETGKLLYEAIRYKPKHFEYRHTCPNGKVIYTLGGRNDRCTCPKIPLVLFGLPELLTADRNQSVFITEGEKHALRLKDLGLVSTSFPMGAGKSGLVQNVSVLKGRDIVILPDHDKAGQDHAQKVARQLYDVAASIKVLDLPDVPDDGGDILDWLDAGNTVDTLQELAANYEKWEPPQADWGNPQPFESFDLPEFPLHAFPSELAEYITQEAEAKQVPLDLPGCLVLGGTAAAAAKKAVIHINAEWEEPLNEYFAIVLPSGEKKSPEVKSVLGPLYEYEKELIEEAAPEVLKAITEYEILEGQLKEAKNKAIKGKSAEEQLEGRQLAQELAEELAQYEIPHHPALVADDITAEALAQLMAHQRERIALISTEGGIFETIAGRYSDGVLNLDIYLKGYSGDPHRVNRATKSQAPLRLSHPALTAILTVQPDVIMSLANKKGFRGRGFLGRWAYALPTSKVGFRKDDPPLVDPEVRRHWEATLRLILRWELPTDENISRIQLSPEATTLFQDFKRQVEITMRPGGELSDVQDWGNKFPGRVARYAAHLHVLKWAGNFVNKMNFMTAPNPEKILLAADTMVAAIALGQYFKAHALAAFTMMMSDGKLAQAKKVWGFIARYELKEFRAAGLWSSHVRRMYTRTEDLIPTLEVLEELGYLRQKPSAKAPGAGRPSSAAYEVNPLALSENSRNSQNYHATLSGVTVEVEI